MPGDTKQEKSAAPAKPSAGPKRPSVMLGGFHRSSLRAMTAFGVAGLTGVLLAVGGVGYWRMAASVADLERAQYGQLAMDVRARVEHLVNRDRSRLKEAAFADELYALIQRGPAPPDSFIHPSFTELFPRLYGDQLVAIYDLAGKQLYRWTDGAHPVEAALITNPLFRMLDNREPTAGLIRNGEQLYWVAGSPILPTNYGDASQPIRGYLVVAQRFAGPALAGLIADRPVVLTLRSMAPRKIPFRSEVSPSANGDSAVVRFALSDVFAEQNTVGELVTSRAEFRAVERADHWAAGLGMVLLAGFALLGWWVARRWVLEPAERMHQALQPVHQGQTPALVGSPLPVDEWTAITGSVNRLIANVRTGHERLDRFLGVVRDGAWERDLVTGDWVMSGRFRELLGYSEAELPATTTAFEQLIHPEDRELALVTMQASASSARPFEVPVRLRRQSGEYGSYRLAATVQTDHAGAPVRFTGRLVDRGEERAAELMVSDAEETIAQSKRALGRLLARVGHELALHAAERGATIAQLGDAMAGVLDRSVTPFDLPQLIQEVASQAPVPADVAILPDVPTRVSGDLDRVRRILTELVRNAARATQNARVDIRVESARAAAGYCRFTVADHGAALTSRDQHRLLAPLTTGLAPADGTPGVGLPLVHELVRAEGGSAGAEFPSDGGARVWFELALPAVEQPEYRAAPEVDLGVESSTFWTTPDANATFDPPPDGSPGSRISAPQGRISHPRFELLADETVVIDLEGDEPIQRRGSEPKAPASAEPAVDPVILEQIRASLSGDGVGLGAQLVQLFLAEAPAKLATLERAAAGDDPATVGPAANDLKGMCTLIGAGPLGAVCDRLASAASAEERRGAIGPLRAELARVRQTLEELLGARTGA